MLKIMQFKVIMQYDVIVRSRLQSAYVSMFVCTHGAIALVIFVAEVISHVENYAILSRDLEHGGAQSVLKNLRALVYGVSTPCNFLFLYDGRLIPALRLHTPKKDNDIR